MRLGVGVLVLALIGGLSFALADEQGLGRCNLDERAAPVKSSFVSATVRGPATAEEIRNSKDPVIEQFVNGNPEGPIRYR